MERSQWEVEKAELQARIAFLQVTYNLNIIPKICLSSVGFGRNVLHLFIDSVCMYGTGTLI
jgi:hypothetical protein